MNFNTLYKSALAASLLCIALELQGQQKTVEEYRTKYPNIGEVVLNENQTLTIKVANDKNQKILFQQETKNNEIIYK